MYVYNRLPGGFILFCSLIFSVEVYSDGKIVSGDKVAALINDNKETFTVAVSDAIVGWLHM